MIWDVIEESLETMIWDVIGESLETMIWDVLGESLETMIWDVIGESLETMMWDVIGESLETIDWIMFLAVLRSRNYLFSAPTRASTPASAPTIYCHLKLGKFRTCRYLGKFGNHVFRNSMKTIYWQMIFGEIWKPWNEDVIWESWNHGLTNGLRDSKKTIDWLMLLRTVWENHGLTNVF